LSSSNLPPTGEIPSFWSHSKDEAQQHCDVTYWSGASGGGNTVAAQCRSIPQGPIYWRPRSVPAGPRLHRCRLRATQEEPGSGPAVTSPVLGVFKEGNGWRLRQVPHYGTPRPGYFTGAVPATLQLEGAAKLLTVVVGVPLGILSAIKRGSIFDTLGKLFAVLGIATPNFWIAIILILLFGAILGWLPTFGRGGIKHFILPAFVLGWAGMAGMVRLGRSRMVITSL